MTRTSTTLVTLAVACAAALTTAVSFGAMTFDTMPFNTMPFNTMPSNTTAHAATVEDMHHHYYLGPADERMGSCPDFAIRAGSTADLRVRTTLTPESGRRQHVHYSGLDRHTRGTQGGVVTARTALIGHELTSTPTSDGTVVVVAEGTIVTTFHSAAGWLLGRSVDEGTLTLRVFVGDPDPLDDVILSESFDPAIGTSPETTALCSAPPGLVT